MSVHLQKDIEAVKHKLLGLSSRVEENLSRAIRSLLRGDAALASAVIEEDRLVDVTEVAVEEECLKLLALHQPVAGDLRVVVAILKINNDLERIGDLAVNVSKQCRRLGGLPADVDQTHIEKMADSAQGMVRDALRALIEMNAQLAREVLRSDDQVDDLHEATYVMMKEKMAANVDGISNYMGVISVSRHLERVADHATNIAEDIIYLIDGQIIRHHNLHPDEH